MIGDGSEKKALSQPGTRGSPGASQFTGEMMGYGEMYGALLEAIAKEADAIAMRYFRTGDLRIDRKGDGTAVTQADRAVEEMARAKVAASGLALDVLGEE